MINLIPPSAKKSITTEYWLRVISVWSFLWAASLAAGIALLVPTFVLLNIQVNNLAASAESASQKLASFEDVEKEFTMANDQARALIEGVRNEPLSTYTEQIMALESADIQITAISVGRQKGGIAPIALSGNAQSRQSLATLRERLLALPEVESVDLPISNLAKDRDIQFSLSVMMEQNKP